MPALRSNVSSKIPTAERPPIGARVRVRGTTGIPNVAGRVGIVAGHHEDGVAFQVALGINYSIIVSPGDVEVVA